MKGGHGFSHDNRSADALPCTFVIAGKREFESISTVCFSPLIRRSVFAVMGFRRSVYQTVVDDCAVICHISYVAQEER